MPPYQAVATELSRNVQQAVPGNPVYLWGSYNDNVAATQMVITKIVAASGTATLTVTVIEGQIPIVGQLISVAGLQAPLDSFNVTNAKITAVSAAAVPDVGVFTVSFASGASASTQAANGSAVAQQIEVGELIVAKSSCACAIQSNVNPANGKSVRFDVTFPTAVGSVTVVAQSAVLDIDSEYSDLGTVAQMTGGSVSGQSAIFTDIMANFVRLDLRALAGSGGKVIGKVTV